MNRDLLLLGEDYELTPKIKIRHPTAREIVKLKEEYHKYCYPFLFKTEDFMVQLYDLGINYYEVSVYEIFLKQYEAELYYQKDDIKNALNYWLQGSYNFIIRQADQNKMLILYDQEKDIIIDMLAYTKMSEFIKLINNVSTKNAYSAPGNVLLKFLVKKEKEKIARLNEKNKHKSQQYYGFLHDVINSVAWVSHNISIDKIWDLKIYQLYSGLKKIQQEKEVNNINFGIYTGNIDTKKQKLNVDWINESSWQKEIENRNSGVLEL